MLLPRRAAFPHFRITLLLLASCLAVAPASGEQLWTKLFEDNLAQARAGDADAQYEVGIMYLKGQGVDPDREQAIKWLTAASDAGNEQASAKLRRMSDREAKFETLLASAENGDVAAQYDIAMMYLKGQGIDQDLARARSWLSRGAKQGDPKAITRLGILHYKGELGATDYGEALRLFETVGGESVLAQYYLGEMYAAGHGVEKSYVTATEWYQKAADGGFRRALGKIINLQEELKMEQRRSARLEQARDAAPEPAGQGAQQQAVAVAREARKPPPGPAPLSALEQLAGRQWMKADEPAEFLPSRVTSCEMENDELVCFSEVLQTLSGSKSVQYRVKSVIRSPDNRSYEIVYRNLVLDVTVQETPDDEDERPPGYDAGTDQGFHIQTGWTKAHNVACGPVSDGGMECLKDSAHSISVVEG